jgi:hypothetical protein
MKVSTTIRSNLMAMQIYEFQNKEGSLLVLAGEGRIPRIVKQDVNGKHYINRFEWIAFKHGLYGGKSVKSLGFGAGGEGVNYIKPENRGYVLLGEEVFNHELQERYNPFGGVPYRILPQEEIDIAALLADERKSIEAESEHWANS